MSFWGELSRRNVVKVGVAYLVVAWLIAQVTGLVLPTFDAPDWVAQTILLLLALGFPVVLIIAWAFEITPEGIRRTADVPAAASITRSTGRKLNHVVIVLLALAVAVLIVDNYVLDDDPEPAAALAASPDDPAANGSGDSLPPPPEASEDAPLPNSVAVLPLDNLSPDADKAYFAAGMHEELLNHLARLENLNVISRTSVMRYAENRPSIREIARELNVGAVIEGSVRYAGDDVLVTVQLIDAATDVHLWSETYPGDLSDVFAIQADIAMNVANAMQVEFSASEQERIEERATDSDEAYDHFLVARAIRSRGGLENQIRALPELRQALALDPDFVDAQINLAEALDIRLRLDTLSNPAFQVERDQELARAIELAPEDPRVLELIAYDLAASFEWQAAEETLRRSLTNAGANDLDATSAYSAFLLNVGRARESLPYLERERRINPLSIGPYLRLALAHDTLGDHAEAARIFANARNRFANNDPTSVMDEFWSLLAAGDIDLAERIIASTWFISRQSEADTEFARMMNAAFGALHDPETGLAAVRRAFDEPSMDNPPSLSNLAFFATYFGDPDLGVAAFGRSMRQGYSALMRVIWSPLLEPVREHPEFRELMGELGLVDYWRESGWPEHCAPLGANDFVCS